MERNILDFIELHVDHLARKERDVREARWASLVSGSAEDETRYLSSLKALRGLYSDRESYARVRTYDEENLSEEPLTRRRLRLMRLRFARHQIPPQVIDRLVDSEAEMLRQSRTEHVRVDGKLHSPQDIQDILIRSDDSTLRRRAWEAAKSLGDAMGPEIVRMVGIRNRAARDLGYPNYYHMALDLQEIEEAELLATIDELVERTEEPYRAAKQGLDLELSERFAVPVGDLMPWHYADVFFQAAPRRKEVSLDRYFEDKDLATLAGELFEGMGLDVRSILERSDLSPRVGPRRAPACVHVDRMTDDIRVRCPDHKDEASASSLFHELGRAAYRRHLSPTLPFLLRDCAHGLCDEAIATFMGRMSRDTDFLTEIAGANKSAVTRATRRLSEQERLSMLIRARWVSVVVYFEKALYENPGRDLNRIWWDLVTRVQGLRAPEARQEHTDWAGVHLAANAVYYHNYILGDLMAAQLEASIRRETGTASLVGNPAVGTFLRERLFSYGASESWQDVLLRVTGEPLTTKYFVEQHLDG